jgi:hypothetical protein
MYYGFAKNIKNIGVSSKNGGSIPTKFSIVYPTILSS